MSEVPECVACGTCCFSTLAAYVRLDGDDHHRLGDRAEELTTFLGNRAYLRMSEGHCAALELDLASGRFLCSVYEQRPRVCRELARGSGACRGELDQKGTRPLALLRAKRAALTPAPAGPGRSPA